MNEATDHDVELIFGSDPLSETQRPTVRAMERRLQRKIPVLDHGFVRVVDYMGDDAAIVQAARVSHGRGTKQVQSDTALINYLMRHRHSTPFEMCEIKLHVKLPIFVARQWIRHRTANVNEISARYSILSREFYIPDAADLAAQSSTNRQGRGGVMPEDSVAASLDVIAGSAEASYSLYMTLLNQDDDGKPLTAGEPGLAREMARMVLPTNIYTEWYWKTDLHNLFHFLSLRADPHAQLEIRRYAEAIATVAADWTPIAFNAFQEHRQGAVSFSRSGMVALRRMMNGEDIKQADAGLGDREWREFRDALDLPSEGSEA